MIILIQAGLYDIIKKEPAQIIDNNTISYKDYLFNTFRLDENIKNLLANNCKTKKEQLRAVAFWIVQKQLNNLSLNYIIDFPIFTISELHDAIYNAAGAEFEKIKIMYYSVDASLYQDVLETLKKNKFEYIKIFKKEDVNFGNLSKKEYKRNKEKNYNDLETNLYETIFNTFEFQRDVVNK